IILSPRPRFTLFPYTTLFRSHALGVTWKNLGRYAKAEEHLRRAVELRTRECGADVKDTLNSCNSLAVTLDCAGQTGEAIALHERSEEHTSELQSRGHLVCRLL